MVYAITNIFYVGESSVQFIFNTRLPTWHVSKVANPYRVRWVYLKPRQDYFKEKLGHKNPLVTSESSYLIFWN